MSEWVSEWVISSSASKHTLSILLSEPYFYTVHYETVLFNIYSQWTRYNTAHCETVLFNIYMVNEPITTLPTLRPSYFII